MGEGEDGVVVAKLLVAGERIAKREPEGPFTNRAGKYFREVMQAVRISPDRAAFLYPVDLDELAAAVKEHQTEYVVLSGDVVLKLVHPELRIGQCHGRAMLLDPDHEDDAGPLVFPVFHHEAIARQPQQLTAVVQEELALLRMIGTDRPHWSRYIPVTCVKCRGEMVASTPSGVVYCNQHYTPNLI